ncbi:hypothetical protein BLNAU_13909 [Blattamonas nauphoetae]|uniref:Uncharacterized protein n=1 Tax=Blattamonas nauphoetae TaxID=2049346 RepID=A0ABQ9XFC8_9EUKA|nr:hypothetical protein BLNAU_13909 [Blattamonas nauphoetae]
MHSLIVTKVLTFKNKAQLTIPSILSLGQLVSHVESKWRVPTDKIRLLLHPIVTNESTVKTEESLLIKNEDSLSQPSPSPFQLTPVPTQTPNPIKPDSTNVSNSTQPSPKTEDSPAPLARSKSTMLSASSLLSHTKSVSLDTNQVLIPFYFSASDTNCLTSSLYLALFPARQISGQNATAPTIQMAYSFIPTNPATPSNATVQSDSCLSLLLPLLHSSSTKTPEISRAKTQILSPQGTPHTPCLTDTPSRTHSNRKKRRKEYEEGRDKRASGDEASDGGKNGEDTHTPLIITPSTSRARPDLFGHRSTPPLPTSPLSHHHLSPPSLISPGTSSILSPVKTTPKQFRTITDRLTTKRQIQSTKPVTVKQEDSLKGSSKDDEERIKFSFFDSDIEHSFLVGDLEELDNKEELSKQKNQKDVISDASKPLAYIDHIPNIDGQWTTISKFDHDKRKKMVKVDVPGFFPRWKADTVRLVFYLNQSFVRTIPDSKIPPPLSFVVPDQPNILSESSASLEAEGMPTEIHKQKRKKPFSFGRVTPSGSNTDDSEMDFLSGNNRRRSPVPTPFSAPIQTRKGCLASRSTKHGSTVSKSQTKNGRINFSWKSNDDSDYENSSDFTQASSSILTDTRYPSQSLRSTKSSQSGRSLPGESVLGKRGKGLTKNKANDVEKKKTRRGKKMLTEEEIAENEERNAVAKMARQIEEYFEEEKQKKKESRQPMSRVSSPTQPYSPSQSEIEAANQTINQSFQGLRRSSVPAFQSPLIQAPTSARLFSPHPPLSQSLSHFAGISSPPISLSSHHHSLIVPDIMSLHSQQASPVPTGQTNMNIPFSFSLNLFSPIKTQLTSVKKG